jgi:Protein involved in initiation of plasmid replication
MATLRKNYLIKKRNVLNEIRANSMTLQELRFFSIYLSKINARDSSTRVVRFSLSDFQAIMELDSRIKIDYMKKVTDSLLCKVVNVPDERGGYTGFQLFKECKVSMDDKNEWYIEIDAHDKALPLMFDFQARFFSYQLWNALRLRSSNQLRMYEILKQYEKIGSRVLGVDELKELLGISQNEYALFKDFRVRVLDACQQALKESTDIKFTYEPHGKKGKGGKILFLKFIIEKNTEYVDQLTLFEFIEERRREIGEEPDDWDAQEENAGGDGEDMSPVYREKIEFLAEACNNEFSFNEVVVLFNEMRSKLPHSLIREDIQCYDYLMDKYREMIMRNDRTKIKHRFGYLRSIIGKDYEP